MHGPIPLPLLGAQENPVLVTDKHEVELGRIEQGSSHVKVSCLENATKFASSSHRTDFKDLKDKEMMVKLAEALDGLDSDHDEEDDDSISSSMDGPGVRGQLLKRRLQRNAREQQRSKRITNQIENLRGILQVAGRPVQLSKASVLSQTIDYIRELIVKQDNAENGHSTRGGSLSSAATAHKRSSHEAFATEMSGNRTRLRSDSEIFLTPLSYRQIFYNSGVPMAIATIDGCFVDCNRKFIEASNYSLAELAKLTVFNLTAQHDLQATYMKVTKMLQTSEEAPSIESNAVLKYNQRRGKICIAMVRDERRRPVHFSVSLFVQLEPDVPISAAPAGGWLSHSTCEVGVPHPPQYQSGSMNYDWVPQPQRHPLPPMLLAPPPRQSNTYRG